MKQLTKEQRYVIQALNKLKVSKIKIAQEIGVHKSTIYRELKRNSGKRSYQAQRAQMYANERKERFCANRKFTADIKKLVVEYITKEQWSPEQIVGYCKKEGIKMVSVERIYQFVREDKKQGGNIYKHLRHQLKHRKRAINSNKINPVLNKF